jgi:uncharacterized protein (TIGR02996 family)
VRDPARWLEHVRAIRADPDDDALRLVCADWLMMQGDPRGEHIALDCALARLDRDDPRRAELKERRALAAEDEWLGQLRALGVEQPRTTRGFVESVRLVGRFVANLGAIMKLEPITRVRLTSGGRSAFRTAAEVEELADVLELQLDGRHTGDFDVFLGARDFGGLRRLGVHRVSRATALAMVKCRARPRAVALDRVDLGAAQVLARSQVLARVQDLELLDRQQTTALDTLAAAPIASLRRLALSAPAAAVLERLGSRLDTLEQLHLSQAGDALLAALTRRPLTRLRSLTLHAPRFGRRGLDALAPWLDELEELSIGPGAIDAGALRALGERLTSGRLRRLSLAGITTPLPPALFRSRGLAGVEELRLDHASVSEQAVAALGRLEHLRRVDAVGIGTKLKLPGVRVEDEGW